MDRSSLADFEPDGIKCSRNVTLQLSRHGLEADAGVKRSAERGCGPSKPDDWLTEQGGQGALAISEYRALWSVLDRATGRPPQLIVFRCKKAGKTQNRVGFEG